MSSRDDSHDRDDADASPVYAWWMPDQAIKNLTFEREMHPHESYTQLSKRLLEENLPTVVMGTIHLALNSPDEAIRLNAQKYITDQMLGPSSKSNETYDGGKQPWEKVYDAVLAEPRHN